MPVQPFLETATQQLLKIAKGFFEPKAPPPEIETIYSSDYLKGLEGAQNRQRNIIRKVEPDSWRFGTETSIYGHTMEKLEEEPLTFQQALERLAQEELRILGDTKGPNFNNQMTVRETRLSALWRGCNKTINPRNKSRHVHGAISAYVGYKKSNDIPHIMEMKRLLTIVGGNPKYPGQVPEKKSETESLAVAA